MVDLLPALLPYGRNVKGLSPALNYWYFILNFPCVYGFSTVLQFPLAYCKTKDRSVGLVINLLTFFC